jgi:histidyl-tRNA synthetase
VELRVRVRIPLAAQTIRNIMERFQSDSMNVKGTRDYLPEDMILRQQVLDRIKSVAETFGFQPMETPSLETWEVLTAKGAGGEDVFKECYNFEDLGGRRIGLRYEITVSLARVMASNPNLNLPFKTYQTGRIWRYGDVSKGRLREFVQFDIDLIGAETMLADAEVVGCAIKTFDALGFKDFVVRVNNRKTLNDILKSSGIEDEKFVDVLRSIDKLDKAGLEGVKDELRGKGISIDSIDKAMKFICMKGSNEKILKEVEGMDGASDLKELISYLDLMDLASNVKIDLSLARGLDYYTGPVFEVFAEKGIGSIAGGGRYDKMIGLFSGKDTPAVGISFGIERIMEVIKEKKMMDAKKTNVRVFAIAVNDKVMKNMLEIVQKLREKSIPTDYDLRSRSISKQMNYANSMGIPLVIIVGEKELKEGSVQLKNMQSGEEKLVKISDLAETLVRSDR